MSVCDGWKPLLAERCYETAKFSFMSSPVNCCKFLLICCFFVVRRFLFAVCKFVCTAVLVEDQVRSCWVLAVENCEVFVKSVHSFALLVLHYQQLRYCEPVLMSLYLIFYCGLPTNTTQHSEALWYRWRSHVIEYREPDSASCWWIFILWDME